VLSDGRVVLRAPEPGDLPAIDEGMHDPDVERWIGPAWPLADFLPRTEQLRAEGSPTFVISERDGPCIGLVWMNRRDPDGSIGYVGYWLLPVARGRGLATAAVRLISTRGLDALGLSRIRLTTAPANERSQRVAERSGFRLVEAPGEAGEDILYELAGADDG
jgi:RimJ/RimL family protein N-acetyltransferase